MNLLGRLSIAVVVSLLCACSGNHPTAPTPPPTPAPSPTPPALTIACPPNATAAAFEGSTVPVSFGQATASGGVAPVRVSCTRESGSMFEIGTTTVQCTATDAAEQSTSCLFNVTVNVLTPRLTRTKFVAFGDSLTMGEVTIPTAGGGSKLSVIFELSYPTKLQTLLRSRYPTQGTSIEVVNAGWSGEWAQDGAKRLLQVLRDVRPEVVIVLEGVNDIASLLELGVVRAANAIDSMAKSSRASGAEVILATLPPSRPGGTHAVAANLLESFNAHVRAIAAGEGAILVDLYGGMRGDLGRYIGPDGLHPTEAGYERMAELFQQAIRANFEAR